MPEPVDLMAALRGSITAAEAQRRRDNEPCPNCGGDRLRTDFTNSDQCHAPHPTAPEGATR